MRACDTETGKKANDRGQGRGAVTAELKKAVERRSNIAVIIAIDFYRQTITPGAHDGYPRRSGDAFFSFYRFPLLLHRPPSSRPRPPPFHQRLFPMHLVSQWILRFSCAFLCLPFFLFLVVKFRLIFVLFSINARSIVEINRFKKKSNRFLNNKR